MLPRRSRLASVLACACVAYACVMPTTELLVVVGTDVPANVPLTVTVHVARGRLDAGVTTGAPGGPWTRVPPGTPLGDGAIALPASFAIVPGAGAPRDGVITVLVEAEAGGVVLRRRAVTTFVPHQTSSIPIFLSARCLAPATGCLVADNCTVQRMCEDRGQTCGNAGTCVPLEVAPIAGADASFGDVPPPTGCGMYGAACCAVGPGCADPLMCVSGRCQRCADPAETCCPGGALLANGTECAPSPDSCHLPGTCTDGVCSAVTDAPDGTTCAPAGSDPCARPSVCMAGACTPQSAADGTVCAMTTDPCKRNGTCRAGVCSGVTNAPDGTMCAAAPGVCKAARTCRAGACQPAANLPDGTVCAAARNPCEGPARCSGGACGGHPAFADGTAWGSGAFNRCCGGAAVVVNTNANCNACNVGCAGGQSCRFVASLGQHYCSCTTNAQCAPQICRTLSPNANNCACRSNADCPAAARCVDVVNGPNYCTN